ncbi:hypothetical protein AB1N83_013409, partial [Pleurotus pulmonarius]
SPTPPSPSPPPPGVPRRRRWKPAQSQGLRGRWRNLWVKERRTRG